MVVDLLVLIFWGYPQGAMYCNKMNACGSSSCIFFLKSSCWTDVSNYKSAQCVYTAAAKISVMLMLLLKAMLFLNTLN